MGTRTTVVGLSVGLILLTAAGATATVEFDWATINNRGNAADGHPISGYGSVSYRYQMATTEVTNAQYAEFLNNVAASDESFGSDRLYNPDMADSFGGITRSGVPGSYTYDVVPGRENHPVVYVSFTDSMRFVNWLQNGQDSGDTLDGVYDVGFISQGAPGVASRARDTEYFLPNGDEWYKAAYHQPANRGGDSDDYWLYPTSGNSMPVAGVDENLQGIGTSEVGSFAATFYGVFDMGGNVSEWDQDAGGMGYDYHNDGGSWNYPLRGSDRFVERVGLPVDGDFESNDLGFRVGRLPGPGSPALLVIGATLLARRRRH